MGIDVGGTCKLGLFCRGELLSEQKVRRHAITRMVIRRNRCHQARCSWQKAKPQRCYCVWFGYSGLLQIAGTVGLLANVSPSPEGSVQAIQYVPAKRNYRVCQRSAPLPGRSSGLLPWSVAVVCAGALGAGVELQALTVDFSKLAAGALAQAARWSHHWPEETLTCGCGRHVCLEQYTLLLGCCPPVPGGMPFSRGVVPGREHRDRYGVRV